MTEDNDHPESCVCKECAPRSPAQVANDHKMKWRGMKRHWMESLPNWVEEFFNEVNLDPFIDELAPDPLVDGLVHEPDPYAVYRDSADRYLDMRGEEWLNRPWPFDSGGVNPT